MVWAMQLIIGQTVSSTINFAKDLVNHIKSINFFGLHNEQCSYSDDERKAFIRKAMKIIEEMSCVRFKEASDQPFFVNITENPGGCYSTIGFMDDISTLNLQNYPINTGCYRPGKIIHELLHILGFYHMQSNYDRDDYIRIAYENVMPNFVHDFTKYTKDFVKDFGEKYDYGSIMHYSPLAFSANGEKTIVPLQEIPEGLMGQRKALSKSDLIKLNKMYKCSL